MLFYCKYCQPLLGIFYFALPQLLALDFALYTMNRYVTFCMKRVNLLRHHGVEPVMVFDGAGLPMKGDKHSERRRCEQKKLL